MTYMSVEEEYHKLIKEFGKKARPIDKNKILERIMYLSKLKDYKEKSEDYESCALLRDQIIALNQYMNE